MSVPIVEVKGEPKAMGLRPSPQAALDALPPFGEAVPIIPKSGWPTSPPYWAAALEKALYMRDQGAVGECFPAGTRIRMEDGSERNIEDVRLLDRVLTAEGNIGRVVRTMVRDADDGLVQVSLWGHGHLRATAEHPVLTKRGYVPAGELTLSDMVAMPRYAPASRRFVHVADHIPLRVMTTRAGASRRHFNAPQGRTEQWVAIRAIPDVIELTPGVGRIFGLFLAEGETGSGKVRWAFNKNEETTLVADLIRLLRDEWGVEAHLQHRPNNSLVVSVYGTAWAKLFESLCATGSGAKRLHPDMASGPHDFLSAVLDGWLDGDGHERRGYVQGVTISRDLALGMFDIAQALGRRPTIRRYHSPTYGAVKTRRPRWEVTMYVADTGDHHRCQSDDTHVWRKVKGIEREDFEGPVYNLEVEGDNSYVAEGIGVHNCNGCAMCTAGERVFLSGGHNVPPFSSRSLYSLMNGGRDQGSVPTDALNLSRDHGFPLLADNPTGIYFKSRLPRGALANASRFRSEQIYVIRGDVEEMTAQLMTACLMGYGINFGCDLPRNYASVGKNRKVSVGRGGGLHAQSILYGWLDAQTDEAQFCIRNSWGARFGDNGHCTMTPRNIFGGYFEGVVIKSVRSDPTNPINPPKPKGA